MVSECSSVALTSSRGRAGLTQTPEDHFRLINSETVLIGWVQARLLACHAGHGIHPVAAAADEVVTVIRGSREGRRAELFPHACLDRFCGGPRVRGQPGQHSLADGQATARLGPSPHSGDFGMTRTAIHTGSFSERS